MPGAFKFWEDLGVSRVWAGRIEGAAGAFGYLLLFLGSAVYLHAPRAGLPWLNPALHLVLPAGVVGLGFFIGHLFGVYGVREPANFRERLENALQATRLASRATLLIPVLVAVAISMQWLAPVGIALTVLITLAVLAGGWMHGVENAGEEEHGVFSGPFGLVVPARLSIAERITGIFNPLKDRLKKNASSLDALPRKTQTGKTVTVSMRLALNPDVTPINTDLKENFKRITFWDGITAFASGLVSALLTRWAPPAMRSGLAQVNLAGLTHEALDQPLADAMVDYFKQDPTWLASLAGRGIQEYQLVFEKTGWLRFLFNLFSGRYGRQDSPAIHLPANLAAWYFATANAVSPLERRIHTATRIALTWVIGKSAQQRFQPNFIDRILFRVPAILGSPNALWQARVAAHQRPGDSLQHAADALRRQVFQDQAVMGLSSPEILRKCYEVLLEPFEGKTPGNHLGENELNARLRLLQQMRLPGWKTIHVKSESGKRFTLPLPREFEQAIVGRLRRLGLLNHDKTRNRPLRLRQGCFRASV